MTHEPSPSTALDDELARTLAIADALRMLIARAEAEGLPAVAMTLRLALADIETDLGEAE